MNKAKKALIEMYHVKELGYDCMGYVLENGDIYTYHHIDEAKNGGGYTIDNGSILCGNSAHPYLNLIEEYDRRKFTLINSILLEMNKNKKIDLDNIQKINEILLEFEKIFDEEEDKYGNLIIKPNYKVRILTKNSY